MILPICVRVLVLDRDSLVIEYCISVLFIILSYVVHSYVTERLGSRKCGQELSSRPRSVHRNNRSKDLKEQTIRRQ
jgi:hypothetical protein